MEGTIIVADDDKSIRTVLSQALTRAGCRVRSTGTISTLWRWLDDGEGDVLVTDVMMPDGDALDILPVLKRKRPKLPVIVMSAQNTVMMAIRADEAGAYEYLPKPWHKEKAIYLFDQAIKMGMDKKYGGIFYGYSPDGNISNENKYFWVQVEAIAAAWRLYKVTNDEKYYDYFNLLWKWCWDYFVDHKYGGWYCILNRKGEKLSNEKSPLGKTDYHTMGACWDIIKVNNDTKLK